MEKWGSVILWVYMMPTAYMDLREQKILGKFWAGCFLIGIFYRSIMVREPADLISLLEGIFPGIFFLFVAWLAGDQMGMGDGLSLLLAGILIAPEMVWGGVMTGLLLAAVFAAVLLISGKAEKNTKLPFIPFLAAGLLFTEKILPVLY